ncbi:MAG: ribosomal-processing cysteine protease Prp [Ruminococcaceae bacterium]|nr:ribosomal-processing cysteine protease Prp [Oscillospiraceae bacterium]
MTKATFYFDGDVPYGFLISGHSDYADEGEDIVCASVSSVAYMTANTITDVLEVNAKIEVSDAKMKLTVNKEQRHITKDILLGLKLHLDSLAEDYPKFLETLMEV